MEFVVTENITDIEYSNNCTGKSKGQTYKIKYCIGFFVPQVTKGYFKESFKHWKRINILQKEQIISTASNLLYQQGNLSDELTETIYEVLFK
jgi:hypothetical protein